MKTTDSVAKLWAGFLSFSSGAFAVIAVDKTMDGQSCIKDALWPILWLALGIMFMRLVRTPDVQRIRRDVARMG